MDVEIRIRRRGIKYEQNTTVGVSFINKETNEKREYDVFIPQRVAQLTHIWTLSDQNAVNKADAIAESLAQKFFKGLKEYFSVCPNDEIVYSFCDIEVFVEKPYALNGVKFSLKELSNKLSRFSLASMIVDERENDIENKRKSMKKKIRTIMKTPEDILYALENRVPFYFFKKEDGDYRTTKHDVRLNVKRIGHSNYALEISDGVWGEISEKELLTYLGHYRHGYNRGTWKLLSPSKLYYKILGKMPLDSDLKVMIAFLLQNRTQDIVEKRARSLMADMAEKYKDRVLIVEDSQYTATNKSKPITKVLVKGQRTDWLLVENYYSRNNRNDPQRVSTYCLTTIVYEEGDTLPDGSIANKQTRLAKWNGPICINTGGKNPSLGDQFASRMLSLMNDSSVSERVSTISNYYTVEDENRIRIPLMEEYTNEKDTYDEMCRVREQ